MMLKIAALDSSATCEHRSDEYQDLEALGDSMLPT